MLSRAVTTFAVLAIAGRAAAEPAPEPYKPEFVKMSTRSLFGLARRADGYAPEQEVCGAGETCPEACGKGYRQCASNDNLVHCFDPSTNQTCCPGKTGSSCDKGYFCSADKAGETWCCPNSMTLQECAKKYGLPDVLTSETVSATSAPSSTSTQRPATKTQNADATTQSSDATTQNSDTTTQSSDTATSTSVSATVSTIARPSSTWTAANCTTFTSTTVQSFISTLPSTVSTVSTANATSIWATSSSAGVLIPTATTNPVSSISTSSIITLTDTPTKTNESPAAASTVSTTLGIGAASSNMPASSLALLVAGALALFF